MLEQSVGNPYFLHLILPLIVTLNGIGHLVVTLPSDSYVLPACYWMYSVVNVPILFTKRPFPLWRVSAAIHFVNGFIYSQTIGRIWMFRRNEEEKISEKKGEELEAFMIERKAI